jgi:hypothetical protein
MAKRLGKNEAGCHPRRPCTRSTVTTKPRRCSRRRAGMTGTPARRRSGAETPTRSWSPRCRLTVGTALDVGCGEGGDVIWLARQGWRVTGAARTPGRSRSWARRTLRHRHPRSTSASAGASSSRQIRVRPSFALTSPQKLTWQALLVAKQADRAVLRVKEEGQAHQQPSVCLSTAVRQDYGRICSSGFAVISRPGAGGAIA